MIPQHIEIPSEVPVMTLSHTVLFPQAIMPLFIFEPRYKEMLHDVLHQDRIFAVAALDQRSNQTDLAEKPYLTAGIGLIRACKQNPDGSSNLVLQGFARVGFESILAEKPYCRASVRHILSEPGGPQDRIARMQAQLLGLIQTQQRLGAGIPKEVLHVLSMIKEPENRLDLAISTLCSSVTLKQELLETRGILPRYQKFAAFLKSEIQRLKLERHLKGPLDDGDIDNN